MHCCGNSDSCVIVSAKQQLPFFKQLSLCLICHIICLLVCLFVCSLFVLYIFVMNANDSLNAESQASGSYESREIGNNGNFIHSPLFSHMLTEKRKRLGREGKRENDSNSTHAHTHKAIAHFSRLKY